MLYKKLLQNRVVSCIINYICCMPLLRLAAAKGLSMQKIPIALAKPGMILGQDIKSSEDPAAMTVCGKGVALKESLIERLQEMGVQTLTVEGHPVKMEGESSVEEMIAALDQRFTRVAGDPLMMSIKEIYRKQILRSMGATDGR